jgi:hypothetical protein
VSPSYASTSARHTSCERAAIALGKRCNAGGLAKIAASSSASNPAISAAVGSCPSRWARTYGEENAFSNGTRWSSSIPRSSASGSRASSALAAGSMGRVSVMATILPD